MSLGPSSVGSKLSLPYCLGPKLNLSPNLTLLPHPRQFLIASALLFYSLLRLVILMYDSHSSILSFSILTYIVTQFLDIVCQHHEDENQGMESSNGGTNPTTKAKEASKETVRGVPRKACVRQEFQTSNFTSQKINLSKGDICHH